ncbi:biopolymer transporter ExbD [Hoeflea alexandrii]|uniref:biopolymer transporter ExbD n=1 Tax=Hoeflea alexandrii TaxID=288436 RepID=UPI0022AF8974|nr:biopolymer transporter ExbD [Hoeflea alexandrii]MCZ4287386.1 biopolymer transporter ExbD [Hoeflea alexandrii]
MTSLIDIIFLLLLFFMLSSTFSRFADVELGASGGGNPAQQASVPAFIKLTAERLLLNGSEMTSETVAGEIERLKSESGVNAVILSVDETASSQQLVDTLLVLRRATGISLQIVR